MCPPGPMDTGPSPLGSKGPGRTAKLQAATILPPLQDHDKVSPSMSVDRCVPASQDFSEKANSPLFGNRHRMQSTCRSETKIPLKSKNDEELCTMTILQVQLCHFWNQRIVAVAIRLTSHNGTIAITMQKMGSTCDLSPKIGKSQM